MKINQKHIEALVKKVMDSWKSNNVIIFKDTEAKAFEKAVSYLVADYQKEIDLDREVIKMLDQLERSNAGEFERYKMQPILKKKLAKERKVIL